MIGAVIADLASEVTAADGVATTDETIAVAVDAGGDVAVACDRCALLALRVADHGRIGWAGGHVETSAAVVAAALESARAGDPLELILPAPSPVAAVATASAPAAAATPADLLAIARGLRDRLARDGRLVEVWAERSAGRVEVGNTRGVALGYDVTLAGVGATVIDRAGGPACRVHLAGAELPGPEQVERLGREVDDRLRPPLLEELPRQSAFTAWFEPRAVRTLLRPLLARLTGAEWTDRAPPVPPLDPRLTVIDDPLAPLRPGSRPIDDDGVVTRRLTLIDGGRAVTGVLDLATAARLERPATGHGWRRGMSAPAIGFSNLLVEPGPDDRAALFRALGTGLLVADLAWGPAPNPEPGAFRVHAPWCFLVEDGAVVARLPRAIVAGNVFDLFRRVVAIGAETDWIGAARVPSVIVDGVGVGA
jgi:predicted Zn-dependent protease